MTFDSMPMSSRGACLSEVLVTMAILPIGLMGAMEAFHLAEKTISQSTLASRALTMVESRLEAKRASQWALILVDDLDHDGSPDVVMHDDGQGGDLLAEDGIYSAMYERDGVLLTWTVAPSRYRHLPDSGSVVIEARASYDSEQGRREVKLATMRANPLFVGL